MGGIAAISYAPGGCAGSKDSVGIILALFAALGWASEAVISGYGMKDGSVSPLIALTIRYLTSACTYILLVLPIYFTTHTAAVPGALAVLSYWPAVGMFALAALGGMTSVLAWYFAIDTIGAAKALCLNVTYSMWAVVFSIILVESAVTLRVFIGSACIILGVTVANLHIKKLGLVPGTSGMSRHHLQSMLRRGKR